MITMASSNITNIINKLTDKARRIARIDGASSEIHQVLLDEHREKLAANPVGRSQNLGPSITNPSHPNHVFSVDPNGVITFGTNVAYAGSYNKSTGRDLVSVNSDTKTKLKTVIIKYAGLEK